MEFPDLGNNCSEKSCRRLDFLPVKCDCCKKIFCSEHFTYTKHSCEIAQIHDVQVPVCPLCNEPVPTPRNTSPDITVSRHIDESCSIKKQKIYTNKCSVAKCKKKELVPFTCSVCKENFCISHRHTTDHNCDVRKKNDLRAKSTRHADQVQIFHSNSNHFQTIQGNLSEDEALARVLALSLQDGSSSNLNQPMTVGGSGSNSNKNKCLLS